MNRIHTSGVPLGLPYLTWQIAEHESSAFTGAGSAHGDKDAANTYTIFTVTGRVAIMTFNGFVNSTLIGASGDISLGVTGGAGVFIAADDAPTWAAGDILGGAAPVGGMNDSTPLNLFFTSGDIMIVDGADIVETTATADITGGQIDYYCIWTPMKAGASVVEAGTLSQV